MTARTENEPRTVVVQATIAVVRDPRRVTLVSLIAASRVAGGLVKARMAHTGGEGYDFLVWNLMLAWVPLLVALGLAAAYRRGWRGLGLVMLGGVWLLFLPNAPYIVTDVVHLDEIGGAPLWYDAGMVVVFACIGIILGLGSLVVVRVRASPHRGVATCLGVRTDLDRARERRHLHRALPAAEQLGCVLRADGPVSSAGTFAADPLAAPHFLGVTMLFTVSLTVLYLLLWNAAHLELSRDRRRAGRSRCRRFGSQQAPGSARCLAQVAAARGDPTREPMCD